MVSVETCSQVVLQDFLPSAPSSLPSSGRNALGDREQKASETFCQSQKFLDSPSNFSWSKGSSCLPSITFHSHLTVRLARSESVLCSLSLLRFLVVLVCARQALLEMFVPLFLQQTFSKYLLTSQTLCQFSHHCLFNVPPRDTGNVKTRLWANASCLNSDGKVLLLEYLA